MDQAGPLGSPRPPIPYTAFTAEDLAARKRRTGTTVSVVIPARDEESTVGEVAGTLHRTLAERVGLIDEVVVVDAGSTDATGERARQAGARVVKQAEVLPEYGDAPGKGEAMWKGLAASRGDLLVFVDADVVDIGPRFVTGLLGPLLTDPTVAFVKACYDRPLHLDGHHQEHGGGRVTELLVRPLLATFWPHLATLIQPLAGEVAASRSLLASLPFERGYGVELAMLLDVASRHGGDAIAQVDLGRRVHVHQPLDALGRMATELLQVALARAPAGPGAAGWADAAATTTLRQPVRTDAGDLQLAPHRIARDERPPLMQAPTRPTGGTTENHDHAS